MKRIIYIILCVCGGTPLFAQTTKELQVDGIKVIFKKTEKSVATVNLCIRGGAANITEAQQGLEPLALRTALNGGTASVNKDALSAELEKLGTEFSAGAKNDFTFMTMTCLRDNWDRSWALFSDAVLHPVMDEGEFKLERDRMVSGAKQLEADPDQYLRILAAQQLFAGTDYAKRVNGVPETLEKLTLADAKDFYKKLLGKQRIYLVVVGNLDEKDIAAKVKSTLAALPSGEAPRKPTAAAIKPGVNVSDRQLATNYIIGFGNAPKYYSPDGPLFQFAMSILYDRYFVELRTKRSLSYAPAAGYNNAFIETPAAQLYITTVDPKQSLEVMTAIINDVKENGFKPKEIENKKKSYLTNYYMTNQSSGAQANVMSTCEASGNWRIFDEINTRIGQVKTEDVNRVFGNYLNEVQWTYLGNKDKVAESDFKQPAPAKLPASNVKKPKD
ncbi:M16 family metallopeptidase [Chitinophaga caseinilytica]|uniref:M16 family metallopeptidase n=1 Tax=Chitinophaga caseinilytica TaxID=2267521 RepID=UPI003C2BE17E